MASCKYVEDAARLVSGMENGTIRDGHSRTAIRWQEGIDGHAGDSCDVVANHDDNARNVLATELKDFHDDQSEHPVFKAAEGTVYSDLLNAALSEVDWREIADSLLNDLHENDEACTYSAVK